MNLREFWAAEAAKLRDTSELLDTSALLNRNALPNPNKAKAVVDTEGLIKKIINQIRWAHVHQTKVVIFPLPNAGKIEQLDMLIFREQKPGYNHSFTGLRIENKVNYAVELDPRTYKKYKSGDRTCFMIHTVTISIPTYDKQEERFEKYIFAQTDNTNAYTESHEYSEKNSPILKIATLATIQAEVALLKNKLSQNGKFISLTPVDHLILDLPIIMCKLGWVPGGVCMLNWIKEGETLQFDWKWFMRCPFSQDGEKKIRQLFAQAQYLANIFSDADASRKSYNNILAQSNSVNRGEKKLYGYDNSYTIKAKYGEIAPLNCAISIGVGDQAGTLDEWGVALGRYRLVVYIKGTIEKDLEGQSFFSLEKAIWRFSDTFDYVDNPGETFSQPLGVWQHDIYDVSIPNKEYSENFSQFTKYKIASRDGYNYFLNNEMFRELQKKIHKNQKYIGFLTISEEVNYEVPILLENPKLPIGWKKP